MSALTVIVSARPVPMGADGLIVWVTVITVNALTFLDTNELSVTPPILQTEPSLVEVADTSITFSGRAGPDIQVSESGL
jgi:hypothetical protein